MIFASYVGDVCFNLFLMFLMLGPLLRFLITWLNDDGTVHKAAQDGVVNWLSRIFK
jgi:hypothetical protein